LAKKINVVDVFSGCGGLSYGFQMSGYNIVLGADNDEAALKTFKLNHPHAATLNIDMNLHSPSEISKLAKNKIDIIIGGPPCQGFSLSGPRRFNDSRNTLYLSFMKLVKDIRPKMFLIENVPGIIGLYNGQIKEEILNRFNRIGYSVSYEKMTAADYKVPQLRNRVFFVGTRGKKAFEFPKPLLNSDKHITAEAAIGDLPSLKNDIGQDPVRYPDNGRISKYQGWCRKNASHLHNHIGTKHSEQTRKIISLVPEGGNYKDLPPKYALTRNFHVAWTRIHSKKPSPTVDTGHRHHFHYKYNRVPTVRENARFQSFPDDFMFVGNKSQQYKQVGNAVPPLLAKAISEKMKECL